VPLKLLTEIKPLHTILKKARHLSHQHYVANI